MAGFEEWIKALQKKGFEIQYEKQDTHETYLQIKSIGLEPIIWKSFNIQNKEKTLRLTKRFIEKNKPCLFIWDPLKNRLTKGYLFGVTNNDEVAEWIKKNKKNLRSYKYLITTQITNQGNGFVGTVFSDGTGNLLCETDHTEGVCNHRMLSQSQNNPMNYDYFTSRNSKIYSWAGKFLSQENIHEITTLFEDKKGYFEFVKGEQLGKTGIYTTGYEKFQFPKSIHKKEDYNIRNRCFAKAMLEGIL